MEPSPLPLWWRLECLKAAFIRPMSVAPRWAGTAASHRSFVESVDSVESKSLNMIGISSDESEAQGIICSHIADRSVASLFLLLLFQSCSLCSFSPPATSNYSSDASYLNSQTLHNFTPFFVFCFVCGNVVCYIHSRGSWKRWNQHTEQIRTQQDKRNSRERGGKHQTTG